MTGAERAAALEAVAAEVRACTRCRLHVGRTRAVPGEGNADTEVVFVGEGPGFNEDRLGRPFVGRAGDLLVDLLGSIGWRRDDVFITNVVKCRPPENRDPQPDEIAACAPYLARQLTALDPALVVTLGRHSMGRFMPGTSISRAHGTLAPVDPETGAPAAMVFAMYHPAAALRSPAVDAASRADAAGIPAALMTARARREGASAPVPEPPTPGAVPAPAEAATPAEPAEPAAVGLPVPSAAEPADPQPIAAQAPPVVAPPASVAPPGSTALPSATAPPAPPAAPAHIAPPAAADPAAPAPDDQLTLFR